MPKYQVAAGYTPKIKGRYHTPNTTVNLAKSEAAPFLATGALIPATGAKPGDGEGENMGDEQASSPGGGEGAQGELDAGEDEAG